MSSLISAILNNIAYCGDGTAVTNSMSASMSATEAKNAARGAEEVAKELRDRMDRLTLICTAMWELLKQSGFTDEQLAAKVREIDLMDGQLDGRYRPASVATCPQCNRVMSRRHARCMYCGHENLESKPFDAV